MEVKEFVMFLILMMVSIIIAVIGACLKNREAYLQNEIANMDNESKKNNLKKLRDETRDKREKLGTYVLISYMILIVAAKAFG